MTVLIEDINDHHPQFVGAPYRIRVEELTPPGLTVFRGLQALGIEEYVFYTSSKVIQAVKHFLRANSEHGWNKIPLFFLPFSYRFINLNYLFQLAF